MKRGPTALAATLAGLVVVGCVVRGVVGCYSVALDDGLVDTGPPKFAEGGFDAGPDSVSIVPMGSCDGSPGAIPAPTCFPPPGLPSSVTAVSCPLSTMGTCSLGDPSACGATSCLPMTDNAKTSPVYGFRMSQLTLVSPPRLANALIEGALITPSVTLNAPMCGYGAEAPLNGTLNWLLQVDKKTSTVTTGGAAPAMDPYGAGYSLLNGTFGGKSIVPIQFSVTFEGDAFSTTAPSPHVLYLPFFTSITATTDPIVLPIHEVRLRGVAISPDDNCIGELNPEWAASAGSTCAASSESCPKWFNNGSLAGFITLEEANAVSLAGAGVGGTLCGLLTVGAGKTCTPADYTMGDYCSTGGSCNDSAWLSATFAANAVKISGGAATPSGP
jgi:hypothetical protein